ncbi:PEP-CTERM sorting domain-containing protein [Sphingomonadales bacterium 56]|uniref:PEP-CTERM sorting domain-containing protein n=1 Tax=Sphingobium agri TaxID=2933566 RepID=A0ABT0DY87_9SPHN|nr:MULTISPECIES: PEP-CTERM sorting domain-containing protein [Sphingomonadaceae]MBY2927145.1 PEP-CTERM sorting domain-containing protein [Sphingomonadales bacterium 56]MBY2957213.1 PEP-CTERM sorting domain-containing protein [Sphingomonadales bacterium 58]MCK0532073.1 PEP-CTERM sorting domain-containing protein [Sphingobium agri]
MPAPPMVLLFGAGAVALVARRRFAERKAKRD